MAQDCNNTMPDVVLKSDCRPIAETIGLFLAMTNPTLAEPIDDVEVSGDVTAIDTYTDMLEAGTARYYNIIATDKTSPAKREGSIGYKSIPIGLDEGSYIFHIETSDEYLKAIKQMQRFTGKYAATVGQDNWIQVAKDDNDSSELRFLKVESVFGLGADPMNNGSDVPVYLVEIKFSGSETYNKISRELDFDVDVLEQLTTYTIGDGSSFELQNQEDAPITLSEVKIGDSTDKIFLDETTSLSDATVYINGVEATINSIENDLTLTVAFDETIEFNDVIRIVVSNDVLWYNSDYYGIDYSFIAV